jgi:hypothetical protein
MAAAMAAASRNPARAAAARFVHSSVGMLGEEGKAADKVITPSPHPHHPCSFEVPRDWVRM